MVLIIAGEKEDAGELVMISVRAAASAAAQMLLLFGKSLCLCLSLKCLLEALMEELLSRDFFLAGVLSCAVGEEGFCAAPVARAESDSQPLYWKVTNPTLSPAHLQGGLMLSALRTMKR
ncbi:hypothetical protein ACLOJK_033830 [Asimina triloba]